MEINILTIGMAGLLGVISVANAALISTSQGLENSAATAFPSAFMPFSAVDLANAGQASLSSVVAGVGIVDTEVS
jgi:hypothetical protein